MERTILRGGFHRTVPGRPIDWIVAQRPVAYDSAVDAMERRVEAIVAGRAAEAVWLLEHPPIYTAGTSASDADLRDPRFPVHRTGRGGQYTYHGPGQRIAYVMLDLKARQPDVRAFVAALENWLVATLARFNIVAGRHESRVGVWVPRPDKPRGIDGSCAEDKIAAIGIRLRRWVSFHGVSLNVEPDLSHFDGIVPCGVAERHFGVTSLADLGILVSLAEVDMALRHCFEALFDRTEQAEEVEA